MNKTSAARAGAIPTLILAGKPRCTELKSVARNHLHP